MKRKSEMDFKEIPTSDGSSYMLSEEKRSVGFWEGQAGPFTVTVCLWIWKGFLWRLRLGPQTYFLTRVPSVAHAVEHVKVMMTDTTDDFARLQTTQRHFLIQLSCICIRSFSLHRVVFMITVSRWDYPLNLVVFLIVCYLQWRPDVWAREWEAQARVNPLR